MSGLSFPDRLNRIEIPVVQPPHSDVEKEGTTNAEGEFSDKIRKCLLALAHCRATNNEERRQKKEKLEELNQAILKFQQVFTPSAQSSEKLKNLQGRIIQSIKELRQAFKTNSHWLVMTARQSHFIEVTPDIDQNPDVKIDPYNVKPTLDKVDLMLRPLQKVRTLQMAVRKIEEELAEIENQQEGGDSPELQVKEHSLRNCLRQVTQYAEFKLKAQETYQALDLIFARDADETQDGVLHKLLDPTGHKMIAHRIHTASSIVPLSHMFCSTLKKQHDDNPSKTPLEHLREWPNHTEIEGLSLPKRQKFLAELAKHLSSKNADPFMTLIFEYLSNVLDPFGNERVKAINESTPPLSNGTKCRKLAEVIVSMNRFNLKGDDLQLRLTVENPSVVGLGENLALPLIPSKKVLKANEIKNLAEALRAEMVSTFLAFDVDALLLRDPDLKEINQFTEHVQAYCLNLLSFFKVDEVSKEDKVILENLAGLIFQMAKSGEFTLSFSLFMGFLSEPKYTKAMPKKTYEFLEELFSAVQTFANLRKFTQTLSEKGMLCLPSLQLIVRDCTGYRNQISEFRRGMRILLEKLGHKSLIELYLNVLGKDETNLYLAELASAMKVDEDERVLPYGKLFNNWGVLLKSWKDLGLDKDDELTADLRQCLQDETEVKLEIEEFHRQLKVLQYAFKIYYTGYQTAPTMQQALKDIMATPTDKESEGSPKSEKKK